MMQPQDGVPSFETPTPFTFLATQLQILQDALEDVKKLDSKKERNQKIKIVRNQILELPESQTLDTNGREDLRAAIATWFSLRSKRQTQKIKFGKTWNARLVLYEENKDEVLAMQARLYQKAEKKGENPKRNFDFLQRAISKVWKRQSKEDRKALQKLAKRWNNEGAPRAQKQTFVIILIDEFAETDPACIVRRLRIPGNTPKSLQRTCTSPSGSGSYSWWHWKHPRDW
jgi:hypothetical protein